AELPRWSIKIFATDLDEAAIDFARRGIYSEKLLEGVPQEYRDRFFERLDHRYRISKMVRQMAIFGRQDLGRGAPFPRIDLVLCRNVLIYFTPELQETVLNQFALSLHPNGYLFLGKAETVRPTQTLYKLVNKQWKVYQCIGKRRSPEELQLPFSKSTLEQLRIHQSRISNREQEVPTYELESHQLPRSQDVFLRFLPTGVVMIDRSYRILMMNGAARRLLGLRQLEHDQDFLHSVPGLPYRETRTAIDTVFREREPVNLAEVEIESTTGENRYVSLALALTHVDTGRAEPITICVNDVTQQVQIRRQLEIAQAQQAQLVNELEIANKHLSYVNKELLNVNEELQVSNEELLLTHEELQASIEEYESTNEELQAANEELETHNEEMQAANEELGATNDELTSRTSELQDLTTQLENERGRLAKMVELAPFYILVLAGPSLIVDAYNTNYVHAAEHQPIQGQPLDQVVDLFQESGIGLLHLARDAYRLGTVQSIRRAMIASPEGHVNRKHATSYFTYTAVPSYDASGKIDGVIVYVQDETKQRLQEAEDELEQLKVVFNTLPKAALALYDAQTGKLLMGSARYLEHTASLHHLRQDDLIGRTWQELSLVPSQEQAIRLWQTALESQTAAHLAEVASENRLGEMIVWDDTLTPIMDIDDPGKVQFLLASAVDITEQVQVQKELEKVADLKDEFLSLASHELRNPLTTIQTTVQLLQRKMKKQQKTFGNTAQEQDIDREIVRLETIAHQTGRMNELITEMLDTARLRGHAFELQRKEDVNIVELARGVIARYGQDDQPRKITLQSEQETILGRWDEKRLEQVLDNLITNALKYSPADTPIMVAIAVKEQSSDSDERKVIVSVHDQGPGIAEKDQAHLFDRFYRGNKTAGQKQEGLGLGLYISHEIITLHGGQMWVSSSEGQGSTFYFSLPVNGHIASEPDG
ncbi:MAG: PAS domain-containing protein, partial [Ktedonobacteraceae bacterium]|nr:PAS domain-containing protein [Ktedonobacteraceae bacterium]